MVPYGGPVPELLAQTTTTTEVPRVVGTHPGTLPIVGASGALLVVIAGAALLVGRRSRRVDAASASMRR
jgi:hypothetical protein